MEDSVPVPLVEFQAATPSPERKVPLRFVLWGRWRCGFDRLSAVDAGRRPPPGETVMFGPPAHPAGHESVGRDAEAHGGRDGLERRLQPAQPAAGGRRDGPLSPGWRVCTRQCVRVATNRPRPCGPRCRSEDRRSQPYAPRRRPWGGGPGCGVQSRATDRPVRSLVSPCSSRCGAYRAASCSYFQLRWAEVWSAPSSRGRGLTTSPVS